MKNAKRILTLLLAVMLVCSLTLTAFATQEGTLTGGSITIDNAVKEQKYSIYQILYLESYDATSGAYAYKANSAWATWLAKQTKYVSIDDQGYVTWVKDADAAAFAKAAREYATTIEEGKETVNVSPDKTETATSTTVSFTDLKLGYYLVDSTLGTLCSLDTTKPNVTIKEKNSVPTNEKEVKEDSTYTFGRTNDADIGEDVSFKSVITLPVGSENVVFKDQMSAGLTLKADSIKVYTDATMETELDSENYTLDTKGTTDYTFKIEFTQTYLDKLTEQTTLYVAYTATVNNKAVVGKDGNANDSWLDYGDKNNTKSTPKSETITYTWDLEVLKYANGDETKVLEDAQFVLLNKDKTKVATVVNGKLTGWANVPAAGENGTITWPENTVLTTNDSGKIEIDGLDADTYYLREIKAPDGYNKLANDTEVKITGATEGEDNTLTYTTVVAKVNNQSGTELPSTGGMGTTVFYILGGTLVLAAVVLLVTKKRMKAEG